MVIMNAKCLDWGVVVSWCRKARSAHQRQTSRFWLRCESDIVRWESRSPGRVDSGPLRFGPARFGHLRFGPLRFGPLRTVLRPANCFATGELFCDRAGRPSASAERQTHSRRPLVVMMFAGRTGNKFPGISLAIWRGRSNIVQKLIKRTPLRNFPRHAPVARSSGPPDADAA